MPYEFVALMVAFAPLFSTPVFQHVHVLLVGAILTPGKRTVTQALRVMGKSQDAHFQNYHRVLNRAVWSSLAAGQILLGLLISAFARRVPLSLDWMILSKDDAVTRLPPKAFTAIPCVLLTPISSKPVACAGSR